MGQIFNINENIAPLVKASSTTISMASTYLGKPTIITVGAQQYKASGNITLNTATVGFNGLGTGALIANTLYYIYAVQQAGALGLVASVNAPSTGPVGFTAWKEIGRFRTDFAGANVNTVVNRLIGNNRRGKPSGEWNNFPPTITPGGGGSVSVGTGGNAASLGRWKWADSSMEIQFTLRWGTASTSFGTGAYYFDLPAGYTPNSSSIASNSSVSGQIGAGQFYDASANTYYSLAVAYDSAGTRFFAPLTTNVAGGVLSATLPVAIASSDVVTLFFTAPIAEWIGLFDD